MFELEKAILDFFQDKLGMYENAHKAFFVLEGTAITVSATLPTEKKDLILGVLTDSETIVDFIARHNIQKVGDVDSIDYKFLWNIYEDGKGEVYCVINSRGVSLQRIKDRNADTPDILVKTDEDGIIDICRENLKTPDDISVYLLKRFNGSANPLRAV